MRRSIFVFLFLSTLSLMRPPVAYAQEPSHPRILIAMGQYDQARALLASQDASGLERAYYDGIILHEQARYEDAVAQFRRILQSRPEQILVRQALVRSLMALRDYEAAEYHLELLIETDQNERNIPQYRGTQRRILAEKPYGITGSFSIVPSSNINRGTTNDVFSTGIGDFTIAEQGKQTAGTSIKASVSAFRRFALEDGNTFTLNGSIDGSKNLDDDGSSYTLTLGSDYKNRTETGYWQLSPEASLNYVAGEKSNYAVGLDYTLVRQSSQKNIWTYALGGYRRDFYADDYRDGLFWNSSVSLRRLISPSLSIRGKVALGAGLPERDDLHYSDYSASVDVYKSWPSGWRTSAGLQFDYRPYAENFTAVDFPREDRGRTLRVSLLNSNISFQGYSPNLGCSFKSVESNIAFYDYSVRECGIGITRRF
jgi:tetratricopeptide (TPR) repeat protein